MNKKEKEIKYIYSCEFCFENIEAGIGGDNSLGPSQETKVEETDRQRWIVQCGGQKRALWSWVAWIKYHPNLLEDCVLQQPSRPQFPDL